MKGKTMMVAFAILPLFFACEKLSFDEVKEKDAPSETKVVLRFRQYEQEAFTRAATDVTELCSKISLVVFNGDTKVKAIAQKEGDASFGTVELSLAAGTYQLVVIAHNGDGSATITNTVKVAEEAAQQAAATSV